jgi:hypothetical protein
VDSVAELAGHEVVLGAAVQERLVARDLGTSIACGSGRPPCSATSRSIARDSSSLMLEVGAAARGEDVRERREEPRPLDGHRLQLAGDAADGLGVARGHPRSSESRGRRAPPSRNLRMAMGTEYGARISPGQESSRELASTVTGLGTSPSVVR